MVRKERSRTVLGPQASGGGNLTLPTSLLQTKSPVFFYLLFARCLSVPASGQESSVSFSQD